MTERYTNRELSHCPFTVFDIETTGGNPTRNGITEIFALRFEGGKVKDSFYSLVNPKIPIPPIVRRMTGISNRTVKHAPVIRDVMPGFMDFVKDSILVSHNTIGDLKFLSYFAKQVCQINYQPHFLCTHLLTEKLLGEAPDKSLSGLQQFLGITPQGEAHRAEGDAYVTLELFKELLRRLQQKNINIVKDAIRLQGDTNSCLRLGFAFDTSEFQKLPNKPGVLMLHGFDDQVLFQASALNLKREGVSLQRLHSLPRRLAKILLQTYQVRFEVHSNAVQALLAEACHLSSPLAPEMIPHKWHQRFVVGYYLAPLGSDRIQFGVGMAPDNVTHFWGPVVDKKKAHEFIKQLASFFGLNASRKGVTLTKPMESFVRSIFGRKKWYSGGLRFLSYLQLAVAPKRLMQVKLKERLARLSDVAKMTVPEVSPLLQPSGVLYTPTANGSWQLYIVKHAYITHQTKIECPDPAQWIKNPKNIEHLHTQDSTCSVPESQHDAFHRQAVLWLIHAHKKIKNLGYFELSL